MTNMTNNTTNIFASMAAAIKAEEVMTKQEVEAKAAVKKATPKPETVYEVDSVSGCDIAITKKSARKEEQLVIMESIGKILLKNVKTNEITEVDDAEPITKFFNKLPEDGLETVDKEGHKLNWTDKFYKGSKIANSIYGFVLTRDEELRELTKNGYVNFKLVSRGGSELELFKYDFHEAWKYDLKLLNVIYRNLTNDEDKATFVRAVTNKAMKLDSQYIYDYNIRNNRRYLDLKLWDILYFINKTNGMPYGRSTRQYCKDNTNVIVDKYGISGFEKFVKEFLESPVSGLPPYNDINQLFTPNCPSGHYGANNDYYRGEENDGGEAIIYNLSSFTDYLFHESVVQGFAYNLTNFVELWKDSLGMQIKIYGKVVEKYPENLASYHQVLVYKYGFFIDKINEEKFGKAVKYMQKYEGETKDYIFVCPKNQDEMLEEARNQSNCLSSYVDKVTNGDSLIYFMRKKSEPEKSFVTIEVYGYNHRLGQVKARFNADPDEEVKAIVRKWHAEKFVNNN